MNINALSIKLFSLCIFTVFCTGELFSQPFAATPEWSSIAGGKYGTGLGIADINGNGWEDIVIANGNDMGRQHVEVYYNSGDGTFPRTPGWISGDIDYHGHLSLGDIDGDGFIDVAVSVFLGENRFNSPGYVKVYMNHNGTLESTPSWRSADSIETFACTLGDADGDGDLDLAIAPGQPYPDGTGNPVMGKGRIYFNTNGVLDTIPGWESSIDLCAMDVAWEDFNQDGHLDLIFACTWNRHVIFFGNTSSVDTTPRYIGQESDWYGNSVSTGYLDSDAYPDYVITENNQLGGDGISYGYAYTPQGDSQIWASPLVPYASAIAIQNVLSPSVPDIIVGAWWGALQLYPGNGTSIATVPSWQSQTSSVVEAIAFSDLRHINTTSRQASFTANNTGSEVFSLQHSLPISIVQVTKNSTPLQPGTDYCSAPDGHWVSVANVQQSDIIDVDYTVSSFPDMIVSNWDPTIGNYIFYNAQSETPVHPCEPPQAISVSVYPNPSQETVYFGMKGNTERNRILSIYSVTGIRVHTLFIENENQDVVHWDRRQMDGTRAPAGMYYYSLQTISGTQTGMFLLIE